MICGANPPLIFREVVAVGACDSLSSETFLVLLACRQMYCSTCPLLRPLPPSPMPQVAARARWSAARSAFLGGLVAATLSEEDRLSAVGRGLGGLYGGRPLPDEITEDF